MFLHLALPENVILGPLSILPPFPPSLDPTITRSLRRGPGSLGGDLGFCPPTLHSICPSLKFCYSDFWPQNSSSFSPLSVADARLTRPCVSMASAISLLVRGDPKSHYVVSSWAEAEFQRLHPWPPLLPSASPNICLIFAWKTSRPPGMGGWSSVPSHPHSIPSSVLLPVLLYRDTHHYLSCPWL